MDTSLTTDRRLLSPLFKFGGMELVTLSNIVNIKYTNSRKLTELLTKLQIEQSTAYNFIIDDIIKVKNQIKNEKRQLYATSLQ